MTLGDRRHRRFQRRRQGRHPLARHVERHGGDLAVERPVGLIERCSRCGAGRVDCCRDGRLQRRWQERPALAQYDERGGSDLVPQRHASVIVSERRHRGARLDDPGPQRRLMRPADVIGDRGIPKQRPRFWSGLSAASTRCTPHTDVPWATGGASAWPLAPTRGRALRDFRPSHLPLASRSNHLRRLNFVLSINWMPIDRVS
jgi:hypothetical protein